MPPWYLQNSKNWVIFSHAEKNCQKIKKIKNRSTPPWEFFFVWGTKGKKIAQGEEGRSNFFQHVKKLLNFWNFVNIKVAKSKLDHFCFYCKLYFFVRKIRKIRNWNWNWVLIGGTPCIFYTNIATKYYFSTETNSNSIQIQLFFFHGWVNCHNSYLESMAEKSIPSDSKMLHTSAKFASAANCKAVCWLGVLSISMWFLVVEFSDRKYILRVFRRKKMFIEMFSRRK